MDWTYRLRRRALIVPGLLFIAYTIVTLLHLLVFTIW